MLNFNFLRFLCNFSGFFFLLLFRRPAPVRTRVICLRAASAAGLGPRRTDLRVQRTQCARSVKCRRLRQSRAYNTHIPYVLCYCNATRGKRINKKKKKNTGRNDNNANPRDIAVYVHRRLPARARVCENYVYAPNWFAPGKCRRRRRAITQPSRIRRKKEKKKRKKKKKIPFFGSLHKRHPCPSAAVDRAASRYRFVRVPCGPFVVVFASAGTNEFPRNVSHGHGHCCRRRVVNGVVEFAARFLDPGNRTKFIAALRSFDRFRNRTAGK